MRTMQPSAVTRTSSCKLCCSGNTFRPAAAAVMRSHAQRVSVSSAAAASKGPSGLSWHPEDLETLLDGRIDKCDLVEAFGRAAIKQQGRPRENVYCYMEPPSATDSRTAAAAPSFPAWCELMQSIDSTDVIDWSDVENDGWGVAAEQRSGSTDGRRRSNGVSPAAAAAAAVGSGCRGALCSGVLQSSSSSRRVQWGGRLSARRSAVAMCAAPAGKQAQTETDEAPHYEGADSDTLFPAGGLEMDDPGHPTDIAGAGKDTQSAAVRPEAKPYMNIKNGRWVPPSKAEAEDMMKHHANMGTDEGV